MKIQSSVMTKAHFIKNNFKNFSWSKALKEAWRIVKIAIANKKALLAKLRAGSTSFIFLKKDGSKRIANGTLQVQYTSKGSRSTKRWYIVNFFDLEKNAWRCLDIRNLITF